MAGRKRSSGGTTTAVEANGQGAQRALVGAATRALTSALIARERFADTAGLTYVSDTTGIARRDLFKALGYRRILDAEHYRHRYLRSGIAERIVEAYPRATWTAGAAVAENPDPDSETKFEKAFQELFDRLHGWSRLMRADILSGLGSYAALVIGAEGDLAQDLPRLRRGGASILYLTPLPEDRAVIQEVDQDPKSERFGLPLYYNCNFNVGSAGAQTTGQTFRVHWTRIVHVAEGLLQDDVYGKPRLRAIWNYLDDLEKMVGGGAEATWKRMDPGMQLDIDPEIPLASGAEAKLSDEVDEYLDGMRRIIRTRGTKLNMLSAAVQSVAPNVDVVLQLIAATTGIPYRILTGSERGELASTQDRFNWNDRIAERRREFAEPLVRALVDRLVEHGALPKPKEYEVIWPTEEELNEAEKATVVAAFAQANAAQVSAGLDPILLGDEIRDLVLDLEPIEMPEPPEEEVPPPLPPPTPPGVPAAEAAGGAAGEQGATAPAAPPPAAPRQARALRAAKSRRARRTRTPVYSRAGNERVLSVLEAAIRKNNTRVIDAIIGTRHGP